ncbi:hypothetical protein Poly51_30880 [Rubripirellula tenax]|uniref:Uncharacterized protein n=1 Tax=Rubripirellula tenax TaxID=2528015 RepID=A0A5C6F4I5_9BACT|nr:hypothetical protein Poly51_30880 [Rubripirellula tenax]
MNPYLPTPFAADTFVPPAYRTSRTYLESALIGFGMSFIAPLCNATYCHLFLAMPFSTTIWGILGRMIPIAICCVILAISCSVVFPQSVSRTLSRHHTALPLVVNSLLYSTYFSMLAYGYVRGGVSILGFYASYYALEPALIAGVGALTHIVVRPQGQSIEQTTDGEPWVATEAAS